MSQFGTSELQNLVKLLNLEENNSDGETGEFENCNNQSFILNNTEKKDQNTNNKEKSRINLYVKSDTLKNIWSDDEVLDEAYDEVSIKEKPNYELIYQQNVTPDDIYLQLSGKGPGINGCENMVIKVYLKDIESSEDITLKISERSLLCKTNKQYLNLDLPKCVDPRKCSAKWDTSEQYLNVILHLNEESLESI